jgi:ankyrin repeat protein
MKKYLQLGALCALALTTTGMAMKDDDPWKAIHKGNCGDKVENYLCRRYFLKMDVKGIDPDLWDAVDKGNVEQFEKLLGQCYYVNIIAKGTEGFTLLHLACWRANPKIAKLLLDKGVDSSVKNNYSQTPYDIVLLLPSSNEKDELIKLFASLGYVRFDKEASKKLLMSTFKKDFDGVSILLLNPRVNVDVRDIAGNTPLLWACLGGFYEIASLLIAYGADVNAKNDVGETPFALAKKRKHFNLTDLLKKKGAKE